LVKTPVLREAIANSTLSDLRAIATLLGIAGAATATKGELLEQLMAPLGSAAALTALVRTLNPDEHLVLEALIGEAGSVEAGPFQAYFGEIRRGPTPPLPVEVRAPQPAPLRPRFGEPWTNSAPSAQRSLLPQPGGPQPQASAAQISKRDSADPGPARPEFWRQPASPLESLWYKGLVFQMGISYAQTIFLPSDVLPILAPLVAANRPVVSLDALPGDFHPAPLPDLLGDLLQVLLLLKHEPIRPVREWRFPKRTLVALNNRISVSQPDMASVSDESEAPYINLLHRLLLDLGLVSDTGTRIAPTVDTARWFQKGRLEQTKEVWTLLRDRILLEEASAARVNMFISLDRVAAARGMVIKLIATCPPDKWVSLSSLSEKVRHDYPQLLRGWQRGTAHVFREDDGRLITVTASWDLLEGAFIKEVVSRTLNWFGLVQMDESGVAFRLSPAGAAVLGGVTSPPAALPPRPIVVQPNFEILAHAEAGQADIYRLEDFADLLKRDLVSTYSLTQNSLRRSLEAGDNVEAALDFLQKASGREVPQNVAYTLREWAARYGQIEMRHLSVLTTKNEAQLKELLAHSRLKLPVAEHLGPQAVALETGEVRRLIGTLRRLGFMPIVDPALDDPARRPSTLIPVRDLDLVPLVAAARLVCQMAGSDPINSSLLDRLTEQLGLSSADEIARAVARLEAAVDDANRAPETGKAPAVRFNTALTLPILETAIRKRLTVQLEYYEDSKGSIVRQQVDPWRLERRRGQEFMVGFSHATLRERPYLLAQIRSVTPTRERFDPVSR
jgi:hypothetical protein